jgi:hypothetical protein
LQARKKKKNSLPTLKTRRIKKRGLCVVSTTMSRAAMIVTMIAIGMIANSVLTNAQQVATNATCTPGQIDCSVSQQRDQFQKVISHFWRAFSCSVSQIKHV